MVELRLSIRYTVPQKFDCLCFKCAVEEASVNGEFVVPEVDDFSSSNDFRQTQCGKCGQYVTS